MKRLIYLSIITLITSCSTLQEEPEAALVSSEFYTNESQATAAISATYRKLYESGQSLYNSLLQIGMEMATDDYEAGPRARNPHVRAISNLSHDSSNDRMEQLWQQSYSAINASNIAIDKIALIEPAKIDEAVRQRLINEARFLRALHYFNLVRWFGGVPLILHESESLDAESLGVAAATEDEVYAQITVDLINALSLPRSYGATEVGRATWGAAASLLSKVYLTRKDWAKAAQYSKEVIDSKQYALFENFADVFNVATKNGKEHIFSAQFVGNSGYQGNSLASRSAAADVPGINGDYADALHTAGGLYQLFSDSDTRKAVTFVTQLVSPVNGQTYTFSPHFNKYYDPSVIGNQGQSSKNLPIIRYAEVLLIYSEALNELNGTPTTAAYEALDQVRQRAHIGALHGISPNLSGTAFREAVFEERRRELVYEYQRWFDLVRRGADYYVSTLQAAGKTLAAKRHIHFPIPQRELNLNKKLTQSADWLGY